MNENMKTRVTTAAATAAFFAAVTSTVMPEAAGVLAGFAIVGGLIGLGAWELKERAY